MLRAEVSLRIKAGHPFTSMFSIDQLRFISSSRFSCYEGYHACYFGL